MLIGQMAIVVTVLGWLLFVVLTLTRSSIGGAPDRPQLDLATIGYLVIMSLLACSALAYLTTRLGYYSRTRSHRRATRVELSQPFERSAPSLTVLVPSYQEDERVIRMTLLSAALQEYPALELVLLIDDPPEPRYAAPAAMLAAAQRLPGEIEALLAEPMQRVQSGAGPFDAASSTARESQRHGRRARRRRVRVRSRAGSPATPSRYEIVDHADRFLVEHVLLRLAADLTHDRRGARAPQPARARPCRATTCASSTAGCVDLRRELSQLRAQAVRLALARAQQGDEPQQLHRADGRQLPRGHRPGGGHALLRTDGDADLTSPTPTTC